MRPASVIWAYWQEVINIEEGAILFDPCYVIL